MKAQGLLSDEECRSLMQGMREADQLMRQELVIRHGQVPETSAIQLLSEWPEVERIAQICLSDASVAWLEKPMEKLGGQSVRQAFNSSQKEAVVELMQQIISGYVF